MSLGTLHILTQLHEPNKVHHGSDDPIRGTISVRYTSSKSKHQEHAELFGPLRIRLRLTGSIELGRATSTRICLKGELLHDGPVKLMPGCQTHYPFDITFPPHAEPKINTAVSAEQTSNGQWKFHTRTTGVTTETLPPSMRSTEREGVVKRELATRYTLDVSAEMPGFDIEIVQPPLGKDVMYDQPRMPATATAMLSQRARSSRQTLTVQDDALFGEELRPHGFRGKAKAILKPQDPPKYVFEVTFANVPKHIFVGQPIDLDISISSDNLQSTAMSTPAVSLQSASALLIAQSTGPKSSFDGEDLQLVTSNETMKTKEADIRPAGPFHKSHDHTKTVSLGALGSVPSSFSYADVVSRSYKLRLVLSFLVAGQAVSCMRQFEMAVHPPLQLDDNEQPPRFDAANETEEDLPSYDEVTGFAGPSTVSD